eukprot:scaffold480554_cov43-Attheya_sp.AAC.1
MALDTMTELRGLSPLQSCAAVLPDHKLRFQIPGMPLVEPSWANVEPIAYDDDENGSSTTVHGVLYKLTEQDFASVCATEGVPFAYRLHRCQVVPYKGDGEQVGATTLAKTDPFRVSAFTLVPIPRYRSAPDIPPSQSYLNVLLRGAREFQLDREYVTYLENIQAGQTLLGNGTAERMLDMANVFPFSFRKMFQK